MRGLYACALYVWAKRVTHRDVTVEEVRLDEGLSLDGAGLGNALALAVLALNRGLAGLVDKVLQRGKRPVSGGGRE